LPAVPGSPNVTYGFNQAAQAAGRQGGTRSQRQINVSTKGGGNGFHGALFEFLHFFKDPESPTQTAPLKAPYRQNQYGGTLSGPVRIPKVERKEPAFLHGQL
jgi:hypothetical protein